MSMDELYFHFEDVVNGLFRDVIEVTCGDVTKDFAVTVVGSDVSATTHRVKSTLFNLMVEMKRKGGSTS